MKRNVSIIMAILVLTLVGACASRQSVTTNWRDFYTVPERSGSMVMTICTVPVSSDLEAATIMGGFIVLSAFGHCEPGDTLAVAFINTSGTKQYCSVPYSHWLSYLNKTMTENELVGQMRYASF